MYGDMYIFDAVSMHSLILNISEVQIDIFYDILSVYTYISLFMKAVLNCT